MAKHGDLQKRLLKTIGYFYPCEEIVNNQELYEFKIKINPFKTQFAYLLIEKFKTIDAFRLVCVIHTTPKIQDILKKASPEDRNQINIQFEDVYLKHKAELIFAQDDKSLQNIRFLLTQNLSLQEVVNSIQNNILLVKEVVKHLIAMDSSVKPTELDNTNTMFQ